MRTIGSTQQGSLRSFAGRILRSRLLLSCLSVFAVSVAILPGCLSGSSDDFEDGNGLPQTPQGTGAHSAHNYGGGLGTGQRLDWTACAMSVAMIRVGQRDNLHGIGVRQRKARC